MEIKLLPSVQTYFFEKDGEEYYDKDLRKIVKKAEEFLAQTPGESIQLYLTDTRTGTTKFVRLPVTEPSDKPFLTKDWMTCYLGGCYFLRLKNDNEIWCGKTINPNHPLEQTTTPVWCPVKFPGSEKKPNKTRKK